MLLKPFSLAMAFILFFSCSQERNKKYETTGLKDSWKPPVLTEAKTPRLTRLDTCPPPLTITLPSQKERAYHAAINGKNTLILPPETKPADFSVLMQQYTNEQGLPLSSVQSSCQDRNGNLWFGTYGGASRYDGKTFTNFTVTDGLVNNGIFDIFEDRAGNLWFGTITGVSRYDGRSFTSFTMGHNLPYRVTSIMEDDRGDIWFGTSNGVSKYNSHTFTNYHTEQGLIHNEINSILQDKRGNIWIATSGGISSFNPHFQATDTVNGSTTDKGIIHFKNYNSANGLINDFVATILEDNKGRIWFGTAGGLCRLDQNDSFRTYSPPGELLNKNILSLEQDNAGNIWVGTANDGAFRLAEDGSVLNFNRNRGLANNTVFSILIDRSGSLWFCTEEGISRFDQGGKFFNSYSTSQGLAHNSVTGICEDSSGNLWFATYGGGVSSLDKEGRKFTNYGAHQGLPNNALRSIAVDKQDNLWFGTENGLVHLDPSRKIVKVYTVRQGLPQNSIKCITEDKKGRIWVGTTSNGVSELDLTNRTIASYTTDQGLSTNSIRSIAEDKSGNLWFATIGGGVSRLDADRKFYTNYTTDQGLSNNNSWVLLEDNHYNLWIGTEVGISRFDGSSFANYSMADGLSNNAIEDMVMDKEGVIWVGADKGFNAITGFLETKPSPNTSPRSIKPSNRLSNAELKENGFKPVFDIYNNKTGYRIKDITVNAMLVTREGTIWAGTGGFLGEYLVKFDFRNVVKNSAAPFVSIQSLKINDEFVSWYGLRESTSAYALQASPGSVAPYITEEGTISGRIWSEEERIVMRDKFRNIRFDSITRFNPLPVHLVLPYKHNRVTFDFLAIQPANPFLVKYQFQLEGYDKDWSPVTEQTSASFGNMREGKYIFKVKAQSANGEWGVPVLYSFKVLPPWYRTWWAYTMYVLIFTFSLAGFIKWRLRKLRMEKMILEEKVALRTNELKEEKDKVESTLMDLKNTQAQLIHSEKMASLGELTAGIAHEIQNPLNFVNNFSEVNSELIDEIKVAVQAGNTSEVLNLAEDVKQNLQKVSHHGKRADAIVKGMLAHSRSSSGEKQLTNINGLADEYLRLSYHGLRAKDNKFNAEFKTNFDPDLPNLNVVPQDIGRVLLNLINNAFQAVADANQPLVVLSTRKLDGKIEIRVSDNGHGIPDHIKDKIFQPFFTTKPAGQGTGLGLSLSYDIIKAHDGDITLISDERIGSTFIIHLPLSS